MLSTLTRAKPKTQAPRSTGGVWVESAGLNLHGLTFDTENHVYGYRGRVIPSVTQILGAVLNEYAGIPPDVLERAADFGRHVHAATDLNDRGELDEDALDPQLLGHLKQWRRFLSETGFVVTTIERRVFNKRLGYAGTLDREGLWKNTSWVLDIKTGAVPKSVGPQLSAYQHALDPAPKKRLCVALTANNYKLIPCDEPSDFSIFQSCLNVFNFKARN
jgi:hypothetical protein